MAKGSRRSLPTAPAAAAVVSEAMIETRNTPCSQSKDWWIRGTVDERRPPTRMAEIGTPLGSCHSDAIPGSWAAGGVNRVLGGGGGKPGVGGGWGGVRRRRPVFPFPIREMAGLVLRHSLPPHVAVVGV